MEKTHIDCKHYLPIDVFKGICKLDKKEIPADDVACENFSQVEKCSYCINFTPTENGLGKCKKAYDAYADMLAKTCEEFEWKEQAN